MPIRWALPGMPISIPGPDHARPRRPWPAREKHHYSRWTPRLWRHLTRNEHGNANMKRVPLLAPLFLTVALLLGACTGTPDKPPPLDPSSAEVRGFIEENRLTDRRGRFREIFCAVLKEHGPALPDYRPCEEALTYVGREQGATGDPVPLTPTRNNYLLLLVPGLGWNCFEEWLDLSYSAPRHVAGFGYEVRLVPVDGLSSTVHNARMINDYVASLPPGDQGRPIILAGYSKGAPDILEAVATYPELAERVAAVVSLAGSVRGSPLANDATQAQANMLTLVPGSKCEEEQGDNDAVASLRPDVRLQWLAEHPLPAYIRYYSVVTFPDPDRVSWALKKSYQLLGEYELRNDTQVIIFDQIIPGSTVTAFVNADHWAIAVPVARGHPVLGKTLVNHNDYPREAFLEALLRFIEEDLAVPAR